MNNEKILYIPEIDISVDDGSGINERNFVKSLLDNNVNVLIPYPTNKDVLKDFFKYKNLYTTWYLNRRNPFSYIFHVFKKIYDINKILRQRHINVVSFRLGLIPLDILFVKKILKKRVFLKHLTFLASSQKQNVALKTVGKIRLRFVNRNLVSGCDTPSYMTQMYIEKYYGLNNIFIAKNGTSHVEVENLKAIKDRDFIYIGRLSKARNTDNLLEKFSKSNKKIDIFGFGEMEKLATEYSNKFENITFHGKVPYEKLVNILPKYKFGIDLTYVETEFGRASYSQKIAQYLSHGLNIIAIDCPDNQFIQDHNCGILYNSKTDDLINIINSAEYTDFDPASISEFIFSEEIVKRLIQFWKK